MLSGDIIKITDEENGFSALLKYVKGAQKKTDVRLTIEEKEITGAHVIECKPGITAKPCRRKIWEVTVNLYNTQDDTRSAKSFFLTYYPHLSISGMRLSREEQPPAVVAAAAREPAPAGSAAAAGVGAGRR